MVIKSAQCNGGFLPDMILLTQGFYHEVSMCVFSSHSFWTSSSLDVPAGVTQDFSSTFFLRCMP